MIFNFSLHLIVMKKLIFRKTKSLKPEQISNSFCLPKLLHSKDVLRRAKVFPWKSSISVHTRSDNDSYSRPDVDTGSIFKKLEESNVIDRLELEIVIMVANIGSLRLCL